MEKNIDCCKFKEENRKKPRQTVAVAVGSAAEDLLASSELGSVIYTAAESIVQILKATSKIYFSKKKNTSSINLR